MARKRSVQQTLEAPVDTIELSALVEDRFLTYSMSVIAGRAIPDVRDGLKPVHRRILWGMNEGGFRPDRPHVKCARVTGEVMGKYHPHGDSAIYDALIRLAQPWSMRVPLIDPHGNIGSPADPPAAQRYVECRLGAAALVLLDGIDEDTVDMVPNFDSSTEEPVVLPARVPHLLINGTQGIAVGLATSIPPHNPTEVIDAALFLLDHPDSTVDDLAGIVLGPDFPTGGLIVGDGHLDAYRTGRGRVKVRAVTHTEPLPRGGTAIVVTEIPYQTSVEDIAEKAAELVEAGTISGVRDIRDESAGGQTRLVFELRADTNPDVVLGLLFKNTTMQDTFSMNMVALDNATPRTLNLLEIFQAWQSHQEQVITRQTRFRLNKTETRLHIVDGLLRALDVLDEVIATIRASKDRGRARDALMADPFNFTEIQTNHILDLTLARLTQLGRQELETEAKTLRAQVKALKKILNDRAALLDVIRTDLNEHRRVYTGPRASTLTADTPGEMDLAVLIPEEPLSVAVTARGYLKATNLNGRSTKPADPGDKDTIIDTLTMTTLENLVVFTTQGKIYKIQGADLPTGRFTAIPNLAAMGSDDQPVWVTTEPMLTDTPTVGIVTASGTTKRLPVTTLTDVGARKDGAVFCKLGPQDQVVAVFPTPADTTTVIITSNGQGIRVPTEAVRAMGRNATGSRGMTLTEADTVVAAFTVNDGTHVAVVASDGTGKRIRVNDLPVQARGGKGVKIAQRLGTATIQAAVPTAGHGTLRAVTDTGTGIDIAATSIPLKDRATVLSKITDQPIITLTST